jgi:hypothetical protein
MMFSLADRPHTSASSGISRYSSSPSRIASSHSSSRTRRSPWAAAYPSLKIRYTTRRTPRSPVGQLLVGRHPIGDARVGDLALGAHDPLAHGGLRDQEGARDLAGRHAAERAQRERHARGHLQRRMAAGEDQPQPVVDDRALVIHRWLLVLGVQAHQLGQPLGAVGHRPVPAQAIDRPPPRGAGDPRARTGRDPSRRHTVTAASNASCTASSASWKSPPCRISVASTIARSSRNARAIAAETASAGPRRSRVPRRAVASAVESTRPSWTTSSTDQWRSQRSVETLPTRPMQPSRQLDWDACLPRERRRRSRPGTVLLGHTSPASVTRGCTWMLTGSARVGSV